MRLQNIPADSCQNQILDFFRELPVNVGGVSIHKNCAFIAFDSPVDARQAVSKIDQRVLGGKAVKISIADLNDVRRTRMFDVRRKLVPESCVPGKSKKLKRIRPTMVKDCAAASKKFCPDEIEFPGKAREMSLADGKVPGNVSEDIKVPGKAFETSLLDGKVPENNSEDGKVPGHVSMSGLVDEITPGSKTESCLLCDNVAGKNQSCLVDGNGSGKKKESCDNVIENNNESCFVDANVPGKNDSCLLDGKVVVENESCLLDRKVSVKVSKSRFPDGEVPVKVTDVNFEVQKTTEPVKRMPTKKTIKPTPVFTLSQFKLVYEGTVF